MKARVSPRGALLAGAAAWLACGPVAAPPPSTVPVNSCPDHPCSAYAQPDLPPVCSGGACVSNSPIDFVLVVSLPESSVFGPGLTVAATLSQLLASPGTTVCQPPTCAQLPGVVEPTGSLLVSGAVQLHVGHDLGTNGNGATLPVHVRYFPLWPPVAGAPGATTPITRVDAPLAGMPLLATRASLLTSSEIPGPRFTPGVTWRAALGPGAYELDVIPDDDAFPPYVVSPAPLDARRITELDVDQPPPTLTVTRDGASLAGFTVHLQDATTQRRVSSLATLADGSSQQVTLSTFNAPLTSGRKVDVVVAPPAGAPIPTLVDPVIAASLGSEPFPALPAPVAVSGTVQDPSGAPMAADLVLDSTTPTGATGGIVTTNPGDPARPHMHYATTARAGADGRYAVALPPGTYDVFVAPDDTRRAGARSTSLQVAPPVPGEPAVAAGQTLVAAALATLSGTARIADGRPLAGALVQALPSITLAPSVDPRRWPRAHATTTDATGAFTMRVDPGTYDVVVQPQAGTRFPTVASANHAVAEGAAVALDPIVVPAPIAIALTLHDPADLPVAGAIVRGFAVPASVSAPAPGVPAPMIEIGSWLTDATGRLDMLVVPPR